MVEALSAGDLQSEDRGMLQLLKTFAWLDSGLSLVDKRTLSQLSCFLVPRFTHNKWVKVN